MATAFNHSQYVEVLCGGAESADPGRLGGKGASFCRLVNLGYRVPAGFFFMRDAFQRALEDGTRCTDTLDSLLAGSDDMTATAEQIRQKHPFAPNSLANP
jgi:phosphoenolpyruvate synthase/pyruvate phosphate dikinase